MINNRFFKSTGPILLVSLLMGCLNPNTATGEADKPYQVPDNPEQTVKEIFLEILVAEIAAQREQYPLAAHSFLKAAKLANRAELAKRATETALYAQDSKLATEAALLWVKLAPNDSNSHEILSGLFIQAGKTDEAIRELEVLFDTSKGGLQERLEGIATILERFPEKQQAIEFMKKLVDNLQQQPDALLTYARLLVHLKEQTKATQILKQLLTKVPDHKEGVPLYAHLLNEENKTEEALTWLKQALDNHPDQQEWRLVYAQLLAEHNRQKEAIEQLLSLVENYPDRAEILYSLGVLSIEDNQLSAAEKYFNQLLDYEGQEDIAHYQLGQIAELAKKPEEALEWYRKIAPDSQFAFSAKSRLALALAKAGQLKEAMRELQEIIPEDESQMARIILVEAEILIIHEQLKDAMAAYNRGLERLPDNVDLLYKRSLLGEKMELLEQVEWDLRRILTLDANNTNALNALGYIIANYFPKRYAEGRELIQKALKNQPNEQYILDSMGWILYKMGEYKEAITYLRKAHEQKVDAEVAAHFGEVLWVSGDRQAAKKVWEDALKMFPDHSLLEETMKRLQAAP